MKILKKESFLMGLALILIFSFVGFRVSAEEFKADENTVLLLQFNEGEVDKVIDSSSYHNDGVIHGAAWTEGLFGKALKFDGVDDYVEIPGGESLNFTSSDFTIELWIKPESLATNPVLFQRGAHLVGGYFFRLFSDGMVMFYTNQSGTFQSTYTTAGTVVTSIWCHLAVARNGKAVKIYKDGVDVTANVGNHIDPASCTRTAKIGIHDNKAIEAFKGIIDELRILNRALTPEEVKADYLKGTSGAEEENKRLKKVKAEKDRRLKEEKTEAGRKRLEASLLDKSYLQKEKEWTSWDSYAYDYENAEPVFKPEELYDYIKILEPWWIWGKIEGDVRKYPAETACFRKTVDIPGKVLKAKARMTSEKDYKLSVNGKLIREESRAGVRTPWRTPEQYMAELDLTEFFQEGENVIAIEANSDDYRLRGIYFRGEVVYETDKEIVRIGIASDETWLFSRNLQKDWTGINFNDSSWENTQVLWNRLYYAVHPFDNWFMKPEGFDPNKELFWGLNHYLPEKISVKKEKLPSFFKEVKGENIVKVKVAIFSEEGFPGPDAPPGFTPSYIKTVLEEVGHEITFLNIEELSDSKVLNPEKFNLLIMPYGNAYPYFASENLFQFLEKGGNMLIAPVLATPLYKNKDGKWCTVEGELPATGSNAYFSFTVSRFGQSFQSIEFLQGYNLPKYEKENGSFYFAGIYQTLPGDKLIPLAEAKDEYGLPPFDFKYGTIHPIPIYLILHNCEYFKGRQLVVSFAGGSNPLSPANYKHSKDFLLQSIQNIFKPPEEKVIHPLPLPEETGTKWEIKKVAEKNVLLINGEPAKGIITSPLGHSALYRVTWWKRAGINYVQIAANFHLLGVAEGEDVVKAYEQRINELERTVSFLNRYGIGVIIFCYPGAAQGGSWLMHAPEWWSVKYPGKEYAYTSSTFKKEYYPCLRILASRMAKYSNVLGYRTGMGPEATLEFLFPDLHEGMKTPVLELPVMDWGPIKYVPYCETMKEDYRNFLKGQYKNDVRKLSQAWGRRIADFSEIDFAIFQPQSDGLDLRKEWKDWAEFRTFYIFTMLEEWGKIIREYDKDALFFAVHDCLGLQPAGTNQWKARYSKYLNALMPPILLDYLPGATLWNFAAYYSIVKNSPYNISDAEVVLSHDTNSAMWDFYCSAASVPLVGYQLGSFHHYFGDVGEHPLAMNGMKLGNKKYEEIVMADSQSRRDVGIFFGYNPTHARRPDRIVGDVETLFVSGNGLSSFLWRYNRLPTLLSDEYPGDVFDFNLIYIPYQIQVSRMAEAMLKDFLALGGAVVKEGPTGKYDEDSLRKNDFLPFPGIKLETAGTMNAKPLKVTGDHLITKGIKGMIIEADPYLSGSFAMRPFSCPKEDVLVSFEDGSPAVAFGDSSGKTLYSAFPLFLTYDRYWTYDTYRFYSPDYSYSYGKMINQILSNHISWIERKQKEEIGKKLKEIEKKCIIPSAGDGLLLQTAKDYLAKSKDFYAKGLYIRALIHAKSSLNLLQLAKHLEENPGIETLAVEKITANSLFAENEIESSQILIGNIGEADVPANLKNLLKFARELIRNGDTERGNQAREKYYSLAYTLSRVCREELTRIEYENWQNIH